MRAVRVLSICMWLMGCGTPGFSALPDDHDSGAAMQTDAGEQHDAHVPSDLAPDAALQHEQDAGAEPEPHDAGRGHRDAGVYAADSGSGPVDAGSHVAQPVDAGAPSESLDAGAHAADSGSLPVDGSAPAADSGSLPVDAGTPSELIDAGAPSDAGHTTPLPQDAGSNTPDAGPSTPPDAGASEPPCSGPPGLYQDRYCRVLSPGVEAYQPQYPLWSDGAKKQRFIYLPSGTRIDTSNPDRWRFPVGTRLYKSFSAGDVLVETRVMEKISDGVGFDKWTLVSYAWSADQRSVSPADPNGVTRALGTNLDIPSSANCKSCHNMTGADAVIGFNAIQLNHDLTGLALPELLLRQLLVNNSNPAQPNIRLDNTLIPGDAVTRAGLGYLHGNCGHCHGGPSPRAEQSLWSVVGMTELGDAPLMQTAQCHCLDFWRGRTAPDGQPYKLRVAPSHAAHSGIVGRMSSRIKGEQMPPIGTNQTDPIGLAAVKAFIDSLDGTTCDANPPTCL